MNAITVAGSGSQTIMRWEGIIMAGEICSCQRIPGQTFVAAWDDEGDLVCVKCYGQVIVVQNGPEPEQQPEPKKKCDCPSCAKPPIRIIHDVDPASDRHQDLLGPAVLHCEHCKELTFWHGPDTVLNQMMREMKFCTVIICPRCRRGMHIPREWRVMME
jgi:hypothetical protein